MLRNLRIVFRVCIACVAGFLSLCEFALSEDNQQPLNWSQFRGPNNGLAVSLDTPVHWNEKQNVIWKTPIHDRGWSSPVIDNGEIWLTTATEDGTRMYVVCVDFETGEIRHDILIFENKDVQPDYHVTNSYASPTPVLDSENVYVHFGAYGTACLSRKSAQVVWQRRDLQCNHYRGAGSSPILFEDLLIFHMDGFDFQYAIALDRKSGNTVWRKDREVEYETDNGDFYKAFSTPLLIKLGDQTQLISPASKCCVSLDPKTGKELWRARYAEHSTTGRPVFDGQRIFMSTGFGKAKMACIRVNGQGDVSDTHMEWIQHRGIGSKPSPVLVAGRLFDVTDDGIISRISLTDGEILWQHRMGGKFSASLLASEKYLYAFDHDGKGYVFSVADQPELLAENSLPDGCNASPAVLGSSLVVRTTSSLYRLQNR
ncbi:MAG: PQQ-binding-like beta-propeller repeat protein [Planctomycetales bacterium]|nr:PQQ-binding-like beta-propeller repeat protein [Planctomycetales bacterium]